MDFSTFLTPRSHNKDHYKDFQLGANLSNCDNLEGVDIALLSIEEDRGDSNNEGCAKAHEKIVSYLFNLSIGDFNPRISDLGIVKSGESITDTYFAVKEIVKELIRQDVIPVIIGGTQDIAYANYMAYTSLEQTINFLNIDSRFSFGNADDTIHASNYLSKILFHQPNVLFNYSNLGYQSYFVDQKEFELLDELFFDSVRLGQIRSNITEVEPILRNADMIAFSASAIAQAFLPANRHASPNGLNGEDACQIARYAGISDKLTSIGFYDLNGSIQDQGMSSHLFAQMIWYFIEGFYNRKGDFPKATKKDYTKYTVALNEGEQEITFYKSSKSDRWWMDVPYNQKLRSKYQRHMMLPCDYKEYLQACNNEMPERWFKTFQKLK